MARRRTVTGERARKAKSTARPRDEEAETIPVLYHLRIDHRDALQDAARRMRDEEGGRGRVNASAALRALLDEWIAGGAKLPRRKE
jgi:hypothetical protein